MLIEDNRCCELQVKVSLVYVVASVPCQWMLELADKGVTALQMSPVRYQMSCRGVTALLCRRIWPWPL